MGLGSVISNVLSLGAQLLPVLSASAQAPSSSSSSPSVESHQIETELKQLMKLLERIKATLYDAEEREIRDEAVKLWLKELRGVAYDAEDVLDEYRYEVLRAQVEARDASAPNSRKRKLVQVPYGMLDQIKQIRSTFAEIAQHREALHLSEAEAPRRCHTDMQIAPTSHLVGDSDIIGREREKEELINLLFSGSHGGDIISVVAIVGTGGIGKTTLAQLVYKDQRIRQKFDKFGWICVPEDFNLQRLTREVVEFITEKSCDCTNLGALQEKIGEDIRGKRIFLVLDDVWNEKTNLWESFRKLFMSASLVKILVTTRNEPVARIMLTVPTYNLHYMPEEESWQLFQHYAFGEVIPNTDSIFVKIGKLIMKKCGMLPLAVKSIASLLRLEPHEESWREILESELWQCNARNEIFQPLNISYARLPTYLKPCFLYCSMFPKDYRYSAEELVKLWISQGYVQNNGFKDVKKVGWEYAKQLWQRSFFQGEYDEKEFYFTLHDVVHDLARSISGHGCYSIESDKRPDFPKELYHLSIGGYSQKNCVKPPPFPFEKFTTLRTFFNIRDYYCWDYYGFNFSEAKKLRALQLTYSYVKDHFSFVDLKHLRFLSLCDGRFRRLPQCICSLYNLQFLTIHSCCNLIELPESIGNLVSLKELAIDRCKELRVLPVSLCQLKSMQKFYLENCYVIELPESIGNLVSLEELTIKRSEQLPGSLCQLTSYLELYYENCNVEELPESIGNLVSLKEPAIEGCEELRVLPVSLCQLKSLKKFYLENCYVIELPESIGNLVSLAELTIKRCKQLMVLPVSLCQLKSLQKLYLENCYVEELPENIGNLVNLKELIIKRCEQLTVLPVSLCQLKSLQNLYLSECSIKKLPHDMGNLSNLQLLTVSRTEVASLPPSLTKIFSRIQTLDVRLKCTTIEWLKHLVDLNGKLTISMEGVRNLQDVLCANLASMHNLHCLILCWRQYTDYIHPGEKEKSVVIDLTGDAGDVISRIGLDDHSLMDCLQPHPNLKMLRVERYRSRKFPDWLGNPTLCASLESIALEWCSFITFLPFGSLCRLKCLKINECSSLSFIQEKSLPLLLEKIEILNCENLICVMGIQRLTSLVKLEIDKCRNIFWLDHCGKADIITVSRCPKFRKFCSQHRISYQASESELDDEAGSTHKKLEIKCYSGLTFSKCFGDPTICASLESIDLESCKYIEFLPFGSLNKLKYLRIGKCSRLQFIHEESLSLALEMIEILHCESLISVKGIRRLKSLVKLDITFCGNLCWLDPLERADVITVYMCPKLRELCSQHNINCLDYTWLSLATGKEQ